MADNAIEKLFEEMRDAETDISAANEERGRLMVALKEADRQLMKGEERKALLANTLHKHIHEGMPIIQAKMVAHEEQEQAQDSSGAKMAHNTIQSRINTMAAIHAANASALRQQADLLSYLGATVLSK